MLRGTLVLLCVALLGVGCGIATGSVERTQSDEAGNRMALDLRDAALGEALTAIFHDTPFSHAFDEPGLDALQVTLTMHGVTLLQAFRAILEMHDLSYREEGDVYHIFRGAGAPPVPAPSGTEAEDEEPRISVDFRDTPLPLALATLFEGSSYSYQLDAPDLKDLEVTLYLREVGLDQALRAITRMHRLVYRKEGSVYHISRRPEAEVEAEEEAARKAEEEDEREWETKEQMLYWTDYGGQAQLRLRAFPYPGNEKILWRSPGNAGAVSVCLPSPSYQWIALEWNDKWFIVRVPDGDGKRIAKDLSVSEVVWRDGHTLAVLTAEKESKAAEWEYDADSQKLTKVKSYPDDVRTARATMLKSAYAKEIGLLRKVIKGPEKDFGLGVPIPISDYEAAASILRSVGYRHLGISDIPLPRPKAAFSPDGEYLAVTTGADAVFILFIHEWPRPGGKEAEYNTSVSEVIPVSKLVAYEGVSIHDLRWSPDSEHLLFTESHYYPARFYAPDIGGDHPEPPTSTDLVRMFSFEDRETKTVVAGENAFLLPEAAHVPMRGPWR